jgi:hypothetical protein
MWTNDATFDPSAFNPIRKVFNIVRECLDEVILRKKEKEDFPIATNLSKRILPALNKDSPPAIQFGPFEILRARVALLTNGSLSLALAADPGEEAMSHLVDFLLTAIPDLFQFGTPPYLETVFRKNDKNLSPDLIRRLADLPEALASIPQIHNLLRGPIQNALFTHREEANELLPMLRKFANVDEFFGRPIPLPGPVPEADYGFRSLSMNESLASKGPMPAFCCFSAAAPEPQIMKKSCRRAMVESVAEDQVVMADCAVMSKSYSARGRSLASASHDEDFSAGRHSARISHDAVFSAESQPAKASDDEDLSGSQSASASDDEDLSNGSGSDDDEDVASDND